MEISTIFLTKHRFTLYYKYCTTKRSKSKVISKTLSPKDRGTGASFKYWCKIFAPWKVAISGFYKKLEFKVIGSYNDKPIVLDDTSNFLGCESQESAQHIADLLNSPIAKEFFQAFIFWDAKRPITIELLSRLNLAALEYELNGE